MQHFDAQRKAQMISLCLPNGSLFRLRVKQTTTYEQLLEEVASYFPSSQLTLSRRDGTNPADYEIVEVDEVLDLSLGALG